MGITIRGDWENAPEWDMGYASFFRLRRDVAYYISKEFGDHYADLVHLNHFNDDGSYDRNTLFLMKKYHCKQRYIEFLYAPDSGYRLSPFKCKSVYDLITSGEYKGSKALYGYTAYPERCMDLQGFVDLLLECFNRRKALVWQ